MNNLATVTRVDFASRVRTFCTPHPRRNLPLLSSRRRAENQFCRAFQRAFLASEVVSGIGGHEFEVHGYGIADFVWAEFRTPRNGSLDATGAPQAKLMAFEMKLSDWARALQQAYRYTYFADQTIMVLPMIAVRNAKEHLALLREMGVGLWGFDKSTGRIAKSFTPRAGRPRNPVARDRALAVLRRKFDLCGSSESL